MNDLVTRWGLWPAGAGADVAEDEPPVKEDGDEATDEGADDEEDDDDGDDEAE